MTRLFIPNCAFCGSEDAHPCKNCDVYTCYECVSYPNDSICIHKKLIPINNWSWKETLILQPIQHQISSFSKRSKRSKNAN